MEIPKQGAEHGKSGAARPSTSTGKLPHGRGHAGGQAAARRNRIRISTCRKETLRPHLVVRPGLLPDLRLFRDGGHWIAVGRKGPPSCGITGPARSAFLPGPVMPGPVAEGALPGPSASVGRSRDRNIPVAAVASDEQLPGADDYLLPPGCRCVPWAKSG